MTIAEIERKIVEACEEMIRRGWRITEGIGAREQLECCALGAVAVVAVDNATPAYAGAVLGVNMEWRAAFYDGFGGSSRPFADDADEQAFALGQELRARFIEGADHA